MTKPSCRLHVQNRPLLILQLLYLLTGLQLPGISSAMNDLCRILPVLLGESEINPFYRPLFLFRIDICRAVRKIRRSPPSPLGPERDSECASPRTWPWSLNNSGSSSLFWQWFLCALESFRSYPLVLYSLRRLAWQGTEGSSLLDLAEATSRFLSLFLRSP